MRQTETNTHEILPPLLTTRPGGSRLVSARTHVFSMFPIIPSLQGIAMIVLDEKNRKMTQDSEMRTECVCGCLITSNVGRGTEADTSLLRMNLRRRTRRDPRCQETHRVHLQMLMPNSRHTSPRPPFRESSPAIAYP